MKNTISNKYLTNNLTLALKILIKYTYSLSVSDIGEDKLLGFSPSLDKSDVKLSNWFVSCWVLTCKKNNWLIYTS